MKDILTHTLQDRSRNSIQRVVEQIDAFHPDVANRLLFQLLTDSSDGRSILTMLNYAMHLTLGLQSVCLSILVEQFSQPGSFEKVFPATFIRDIHQILDPELRVTKLSYGSMIVKLILTAKNLHVQ